MLMNGPPPEICLAGGYGIGGCIPCTCYVDEWATTRDLSGWWIRYHHVLVMLMNGPPPEICVAGGYGITMYLLC